MAVIFFETFHDVLVSMKGLVNRRDRDFDGNLRHWLDKKRENNSCEGMGLMKRTQSKPR